MEPPRSLIPDMGAAVGPGQIANHMTPRSWGLLLVVSAFLLLGAGETDTSPAGSPPKPEAVSFLLVKGHVVSLSAEACVIRNAKGEAVSFTVDEQTAIVGIVQEGDWVAVYASPDGVARSIFK